VANGELTKLFTEALFAKFPSWQTLAKPVSEPSGKVAIKIEVPQENSEYILYLSTTDGEITVGFADIAPGDEWHTHVGPFLGITEEESVLQAVNIIEDFVNEEAVVIVVKRDGVWAESTLQYRCAPIPPAEHAVSKVFSWKHSYDKTIDSP
jgi:hypothetical protein